MVTVVLVVSYLVYLCRGIPDSIIGAAWPLMYLDFDVSVSLVSVLTIGVSLFTALASVVSSKFILKFGVFKILAVSLLIMSFTVLGFGLSRNFFVLCILSIPLGFCIGTMENTLSSYLALRYKVIFLNLLHGVCGLGAILSPILISMAITQKNNWREGYFLAFYILIGVWVVLMASMPVWKKSERAKNTYIQTENTECVSISFVKQLKHKPVALIYLIVFATNALEYSLCVWGSTYFTEARAISPEIAATLITALYAGMTTGRLSGAFLSLKISCKKLVLFAVSILSVICIMLFFKLNIIILYVLMFIFGFANGPIYPLMLSATPEVVGVKISQSVIGMEIAFAYIGCVLTHISLGFLVKYFSINILPVYTFVSYVLMAVVFVAFMSQVSKNSKKAN